ncbi:MAG: hypothetical protein C3F06_06405 [Candidatus Methanoperedenaceae archaeon]|nr:MAG: hypothetical protein C3F06_06405 [Candidatus Methanoperedenaceae archaeon]
MLFLTAHSVIQPIFVIKLNGDTNNNTMERANGEVRDMEKVMRGVKVTNTPILPRNQIFDRIRH